MKPTMTKGPITPGAPITVGWADFVTPGVDPYPMEPLALVVLDAGGTIRTLPLTRCDDNIPDSVRQVITCSGPR